MGLSEEIKIIRQKGFLSQSAFASELNVSFSTVNRWETGKTRPNLSAMKEIKSFCDKHGMAFADIEKEWLKHSMEVDSNGQNN